MAGLDTTYAELCERVLYQGYLRPARVGGEAYSLPGLTLSTAMVSHAFPILTTRQIFPKGVIGELAAFLQGAEDLATFEKFGCNYWAHNAGHWINNVGLEKADWQVGRIYGAQWRRFGPAGPDQLVELVEGLTHDPYSRRHILACWNPEELSDMCLPPCHILAQFYVKPGGLLDCIVYMRSVDLALGLPSDLVLYGVLLMLVAKKVDMQAGQLHFQFGDAHIYAPHAEALQQQCARETNLAPPLGLLKDKADLFTFEPDDFALINYIYMPRIDYELF